MIHYSAEERRCVAACPQAATIVFSCAHIAAELSFGVFAERRRSIPRYDLRRSARATVTTATLDIPSVRLRMGWSRLHDHTHRHDDTHAQLADRWVFNARVFAFRVAEFVSAKSHLLWAGEPPGQA